MRWSQSIAGSERAVIQQESRFYNAVNWPISQLWPKSSFGKANAG
jgi:hypothetical protein